MACIEDRYIRRPPRLLIMVTLLSMISFSIIPASSASISTDAEVNNATPIITRRRRRRRKLQFTTTANSADDAIESYKLLHQKGNNATLSSSSVVSETITANSGELICTPMEECELCPTKWKQMLEKDDEKVKGEFESCTKYGRRQEFECTVLLQGEFYVFYVSKETTCVHYYLFCYDFPPHNHIKHTIYTHYKTMRIPKR